MHDSDSIMLWGTAAFCAIIISGSIIWVNVVWVDPLQTVEDLCIKQGYDSYHFQYSESPELDGEGVCLDGLSLHYHIDETGSYVTNEYTHARNVIVELDKGSYKAKFSGERYALQEVQEVKHER